MYLEEFYGDQASKIPSKPMFNADGKITGYYYDLTDIKLDHDYLPLTLQNPLILSDNRILKQGDKVYFDVEDKTKPKQGDLVVLLKEGQNNNFKTEPVIYCDEMSENTLIKRIFKVKIINKTPLIIT